MLALVAGLSVAALVAIVAILTQSFDQVDLRIVATSLGFSLFSVLGAAGARPDRAGRRHPLGNSTIVAAAASYGLLLVGLWIDHAGGVWRSFGVVTLATLATAHARLVLGAVRATDSPLIRRLTAASLVSAAIDFVLGGLAIVGAIEQVSSEYLRLLGVLVIVMLLSTVLPPLLRRLQRDAAVSERESSPLTPTAPASAPGVTELLTIADQLDGLVQIAGPAAGQIGSHAAQLRRIARKLGRELPSS